MRRWEETHRIQGPYQQQCSALKRCVVIESPQAEHGFKLTHDMDTASADIDKGKDEGGAGERKQPQRSRIADLAEMTEEAEPSEIGMSWWSASRYG